MLGFASHQNKTTVSRQLFMNYQGFKLDINSMPGETGNGFTLEVAFWMTDWLSAQEAIAMIHSIVFFSSGLLPGAISN